MYLCEAYLFLPEIFQGFDQQITSIVYHHHPLIFYFVEQFGKFLEGFSNVNLVISQSISNEIKLKGLQRLGKFLNSRGIISHCADKRVAVFNHVFDEFIGPLQLLLITLEPLAEIRAVQVAIAELQRGMPHGSVLMRFLGTAGWFVPETGGLVIASGDRES